MRKIAVIVLLLVSSVLADTEITSLPITLSTPGERYYLTQNLDWPGTAGQAAISIEANGIELDLSGFTITFGSNDVGNIDCIKMPTISPNVGYDSVLIHNGTITHNPTDSSLALDATHCIELNHTAYVTVRNVTMFITGRVATAEHYNGIHAVYLLGQTQHHNRIVSCTINQSVTAFWEREDRQACAISTNYTETDAAVVDFSTDYTLKVDSCMIFYPNIGLLAGRVNSGGDNIGGVYHIEYNHFTGRVRNDGPYISTYRFGNAFAVDAYHAENIRAVGNRMDYDSTDGTKFFGGQGYFFNVVGGGDMTDTNFITNDTIISAGGPGIGFPSGVKIRSLNDAIIFSDCYFEAHADTNTADSTREDRAQNIEIGHSYAVTSNTPYIAFNNCTFDAQDRTDGSTVYNMFYRYWPIGFGYKLFTSGCHFTTDQTALTFGDLVTSTQVQADSIFSYNDTFVLGSNHDGSEMFTTYYNTVENQYNHILNPTYQNGAAWGYDYGTANTQALTEEVEMVITVEDGDGNPINGATVWCLNSAQADTVFKKTSNASGVVYDTVSTNFISRTATDTTLAQYNDFTVGAAYTGDTSTVTWTITLTDNDTTLTLGDVNLSQSNVVVDTNNTSAYIQTTFTAIDSAVRWYKLLWGTSNPPTVKYGDSITSPTNPDTFVVSPLIQNTKYYFMTVARDSVTTDTSAVDSITTLKTRAHTVTVTDTNEVNFVVVDDYTANSVDSIWLVWDDDSDMADSLGRFVITSGITDPDTMVASGLSGGTLYYYRVRLVDQLGLSSSSVQSVTTITPALDRPVVLNDNIRISGKVIIK